MLSPAFSFIIKIVNVFGLWAVNVIRPQLGGGGGFVHCGHFSDTGEWVLLMRHFLTHKTSDFSKFLGMSAWTRGGGRGQFFTILCVHLL